MDKQDIVALVLEATQELVSTMPEPPAVSLSEDTMLFGDEGFLDSMYLVTLVIDVEQKLQEQLELNLTLADQRAMSQEHSPFQTVGTLADYVWDLVAQNVQDRP